jgi:hypothetical protein
MDVISEKIISKFESVVITIFLSLIVLLFSSVSFSAKLILSFLLLIIFFIRLYLSKSFLFSIQSTKHISVIVVIALVFLSYLFFNTYYVSKIPFESKTEFLNFCFYIATFFVFCLISVQNKSLEKELIINFLLVQMFLLLLYIFWGEKLLNFFVYNQNILAGYCLFSWLFSFFYLYENKQKYKFLVYITLTISTLFFLLLKSFSAIFISVSILLFIFLKNKLIKYLSVVFLLTTFIVINFNSVVDRLLWIMIGGKIWLNHFFFGIGLGNFKFYYPQYTINLPIEPSTATIFVHNYFVHITSEIGFIGLFIFLSLIIYSLKKVKNKVFLYTIYGVVIQSFIDYVLYIPQNSILFFIFLSVLATENKNIQVTDKKNKNIILVYVFCLFILTFCIVSFIKMDKIVLLTNSNKKNELYKTVSIDKTYWFGWKHIAVMLTEEGKLEEAKKMFFNVIKTNPLDAESYLYLAMINFNCGNKTEGYKFLKQMVYINPKMANKYIKILRSELK